ncbi:transcriptional regulator [Candidatus Bipolaricaulota bacterium]
MNLRKLGRAFLGIGLILLVLAMAIALVSIARYKRSAWSAFQAHCQAQIDTLESFTEQWIVRGQPESIRSAAQLLLLGTGLYVDVALPNGELVSERVEGLPPHLTPDVLEADETNMGTEIREVLYELREMTIPISLEGNPGSVIGVIRVGFSGQYVADRIRDRRFLLLGSSLGSWLAVMIGCAFVMTAIQRKRLADAPNDRLVKCGTLQIDLESREVILNGVSLNLTRKQYELLCVFARHPGAVFSDDDLLRELWADSDYAASSDVKQCIYMLRRELRRAHLNPKHLIINVKGFGYRLDPDATESNLTCD